MLPTQSGSLRLFRFRGIDVFVHWSWFLYPLYRIQTWQEDYASPIWKAYECLALFGIVLLHEFGHSLACRQTGGRADRIVLWPLGGVAFVDPPPRAGATLWSIAAGPLVNVVLVPVLFGLSTFAADHWFETAPETVQFLRNINQINLGLLIFNLLPIYPLDGGQILRSLLWFWLGRARSLMVAASLGFVGVAGLAALAVWAESYWLGLIAYFAATQCWRSLQHARGLARVENAPLRPGIACPVCHAAPPTGNFWGCSRCRQAFDTFATQGVCPQCQTRYESTRCTACGQMQPLPLWYPAAPDLPPPLPPV